MLKEYISRFSTLRTIYHVLNLTIYPLRKFHHYQYIIKSVVLLNMEKHSIKILTTDTQRLNLNSLPQIRRRLFIWANTDCRSGRDCLRSLVINMLRLLFGEQYQTGSKMHQLVIRSVTFISLKIHFPTHEPGDYVSVKTTGQGYPITIIILSRIRDSL